MWAKRLFGSAHCADLSVPENPQFVSYESIARTENAGLLIFEGVAGCFCWTIDATTLFGDDSDRVARACLFFCKLHSFLVLL